MVITTSDQSNVGKINIIAHGVTLANLLHGYEGQVQEPVCTILRRLFSSSILMQRQLNVFMISIQFQLNVFMKYSSISTAGNIISDSIESTKTAHNLLN